MENKDKTSMENDRDANKPLQEEELGTVSGGTAIEDIEMSWSSHTTYNCPCVKCGRVTPHTMTKLGTYVCNYCNTPIKG